MIKIKPQNTKGTRDFLPSEVAKRQYIFETIKKNFHLYGFSPIETPAFERLETINGKYGEEGDRLLFKILNSGDYLSGVDPKMVIGEDGKFETKKITPQIAEKGLRYDLTVPLARYVVQHQNDLVFPFRRYHIGPVWRADRPQKGRYQEFYQCDADIIGTNSLLSEVDLLNLFSASYGELGIEYQLKINNRKILQGVIETCDLINHFTSITVIIDKLDKIGMDGVKNELLKLDSIKEDQVDRLISFLDTKDLSSIKTKLKDSEVGLKGLEELDFILPKLDSKNIVFDITLARGIDYYTGCICEMVCTNYAIGSIGGGGRYDNLTELFGGKDMSGMGVSFGIERIYDVMEALNLFPQNIELSTKVLITNFGEEEQKVGLSLLNALRKNKISAEIYPSSGKLEKQMKYANNKNIAFVVLIGSNELNSKKYQLKDMTTGEQRELGIDEMINFLR